MRTPFPAKFHGGYDLIHIRLIAVALAEDEWVPTLRNIQALLKPGGWLQWEDADLNPAAVVVKASMHTETEAAQGVMDFLLETMKDKFPPASKRFRNAMTSSTLTNIQHDALALDRLPKHRSNALNALMGVAYSIAKKQAKTNPAGADKLAAFEDLSARAREEIETGAYVMYRIDAWRGQQPVATSPKV